MQRLPAIIAAAVAATAVLVWHFRPTPAPTWSPAELKQIATLWIGTLEATPPSPTNRVADDPLAARFGHALFFDTRFSANGGISCATCHQPHRDFTDGLKKAVALGRSRRNTPSLVGTAYSPWFYWDGRKDSLWSQALSPLEDPAEHGGNRLQIVRTVASDATYRQAYERIFTALPDFSDSERFPNAAAPGISPALDRAWRGMAEADRNTVNRVFSNIGKALAAYERKLIPGPSRFDAYAAAVAADDRQTQAAALSNDEAQGLKLFIGDARCTECHNGPLFTNNEFHNTGVLSYPGDLPDRGRSDGLRQVRADVFNCLGPFSDADHGDCAELEFAREGPELIGATRTPSLRNLRYGAPFMHRGQLASLAEVVEHYDRAELAMIGHNEAKPLSLSCREKRQLVAFLRSLAADPAVDAAWLEAPAANALTLSLRAQSGTDDAR